MAVHKSEWEYWRVVPYGDWRKRVEGMNVNDRMKLTDSAASAAVWLARLSAYVSRRVTGGGHLEALKRQNEVARRVRRALGYTYPDDEVRF